MKASLIAIDPWIRESNLIEDIDSHEADLIAQTTWGIILEDTKLTRSLILKTHWGITHTTLGSDAGALRRCDVTVGGRTCPAWELVSGLLNEWMEKYQNPDTEEMIQKAHVEFEKIHPFVDGNGRTGRMLMNWQRLNAGYDPLLLQSSERNKYYQWFKS